MRLTDFDALSFDCYGTLIDWETGLCTVLGEWADRRGLGLPAEDLLSGFSSFESPVQSERPTMLYPDVLATSLRRFGEQLGAEVSDQDAGRIARSVPDWPAFPDSPAALATLAGHYRLIILSNVDRTSFAGSNERLGVDFTSILTAQDIGSYKPSPRNFEALLAERDRLGIAPGRLLHVAQSLFHDHLPAKAAGLPTVWINRRRDVGGWGATPQPSVAVTPDREYGSMAEFAAAAAAEQTGTWPSGGGQPPAGPATSC